MKLTKEQLQKIEKFGKKESAKNDIYHQTPHLKETVRISKYLAKKENGDINKCIVIAWLHDICKYKQSRNKDHGAVGAKKAKKFLKKLKFNKKDIEDICYAIYEHNKGGKKKIIEAGVIWDADKLQGIGANGILRGYGYEILKIMPQEQAYKDSIVEQRFFLKRFKTKTGKKIANQYFKFVKKFDKERQKIKKLK